MQFPDQSHINRVREALWRRQRNASVMIGAGFSRNAEKIAPYAPDMPTWQEIVHKLCERLYPHSDKERLAYALREASGTSGFLRLAQEYECAFGRSAIHNFIRGTIPDLEYAPGDLHQRLMNLPWKDLFTTNWDTLLERAQANAPKNFYSVVKAPEELSHAASPRLIKLHGSLPSKTPFIFTEEDYRRYPIEFSPFVNTVQQAMMETVFILIGFSGDDPNFLQWSGWVRDNLGALAPKIYLAGWLDLSPHRRRMLEDRNVVPIDIAKHPQAHAWPSNQKHSIATEWLITTLENGRSYDISRWPTPQAIDLSKIHKHLLPIETPNTGSPVNEPSDPQSFHKSEDIQSQLEGAIEAWKQNRQCYPGWIFCPFHKKYSMSNTWRWSNWILKNQESLKIETVLEGIYELIWKDEKLLAPMFEEVRAAIEIVIEKFNLETKEINGKSQPEKQWNVIKEHYLTITQALTTSFRLDLDEENFMRHIATLKQHLSASSTLSQFINYEMCLWHNKNFDYIELEKSLKNWSSENSDPVWAMRKSSMLISIGKTEQAAEIVKKSLLEVRNSSNNDTSLHSASREGWLLWLNIALGDDRSGIEDYWIRWQELTPLECNAQLQKDEIYNNLKKPRNEKTPAFNLGARKGKTIFFSNPNHFIIESYRALRLTESTGLPPFHENTLIASDLLRLSSETLASSEPKLAMRTVLGAVNSERDESFERVWSRSRIAQRPQSEMIELAQQVKSGAEFCIKELQHSYTQTLSRRLNVLIEGLSRLAIRLPSDTAKSLFLDALKYYQIEILASDQTCKKVLENLIDRAWDALDQTSKVELSPTVLRSPILGLNNTSALSQYDLDLPEILESRSIIRKEEDATEWVEITNIIRQSLSSHGEARKRAAFRLLTLVEAKALMPNELEEFAKLIWNYSESAPEGFPADIGLEDWQILSLPETTPGISLQIFKEKWLLSNLEFSDLAIYERLYQIGKALSIEKYDQTQIIFNEAERQSINNVVLAWTEHQPKRRRNPSESGFNSSLIGLKEILKKIPIPPELAERILEKSYQLANRKIYSLRLIGLIAKFLPEKTLEISRQLRISIASNESQISEDAIFGLYEWLKDSTQSKEAETSPPRDLIIETGVVIASRRPVLLYHALEIAAWIFKTGSKDQQESILELALHGLSQLIDELDYKLVDLDASELDIPLCRFGCVKLARALHAAGHADVDCVKQWLDAALNDPLPELRKAD